MKSTLTKEQIIRTLKHPQHQEKLKAYGVIRLGLYGSFAREEGREDSNINFLVDWMDDDAEVENTFTAEDYLESLFHHEVILMTSEAVNDPTPRYQQLKKNIHKELINIPLHFIDLSKC